MVRSRHTFFRSISRFSAGIAIALLAIFASMHVIQAIHSHVEQAAVTRHDDGVNVQKNIARCQLCDYLLHKHSGELQGSDVALMSHFPGKPVKLGVDQLSRIRARMAELWTNKGPPSAARA